LLNTIMKLETTLALVSEETRLGVADSRAVHRLRRCLSGNS
jgi:hypothetical protein